MELSEQTLKRVAADPAAQTMVDLLRRLTVDLRLDRASLYYQFPVYKDEEQVLSTDVLVLSPNHGVLVFGICAAAKGDVRQSFQETDRKLDQVFNHLYSRFIRYRTLRSSKRELSFAFEAAIYAPFADDSLVEMMSTNLSAKVIKSEPQVMTFFGSSFRDTPLQKEIFDEIISIVEGSKALPRPKERKVESYHVNSKVAQVARLEAEINRFDRDQKTGYMGVLNGPQRIRGLAGSGKTVVLAMKAALTHLQDSEASIAYTFHTKSLYQLVQRLITRFYRLFDDKDPNWEKLTILHAWGGRTNPGIYFNACLAHNVKPLTYDQAQMLSSKPVFEFVCEDLLSKAKINPIYDYVFVDEGQDFPASFMRLSLALARNKRLVLAYDELQTIFQASAPSMLDMFGTDSSGNPLVVLEEDVVLHRCYRNPLEVLVSAHALGFGIYGKKIVQMLENEDHWEDLGYEVQNEELIAGQLTRILRPPENSPSSISVQNAADEIIVTNVYSGLTEEVRAAANAIQNDIQTDGLDPEDILVIAADDRNAREYLQAVAKQLARLKIQVNNLHEDTYGIRDFAEKGCVTLSTIHKAKGNEAYVVYVLGIDALARYSGVRSRNMIFTAMTRAKAWLRVSGIGPDAQTLIDELKQAKEKLPYLEFVYPTEAEIKVMRRDLQETPEQRVDRALEEVENDLPSEELVKVLEQKLRTLRGPRRGNRKK